MKDEVLVEDIELLNCNKGDECKQYKFGSIITFISSYNTRVDKSRYYHN